MSETKTTDGVSAVLSTDGLCLTYCKKEFLTDSPDPGTSTVASFCGDIKWRPCDEPEHLEFLEISSCHERARLHRTYDMTRGEWIAQVKRLRAHLDEYINFLEA